MAFQDWNVALILLKILLFLTIQIPQADNMIISIAKGSW
jgi:hypothetical protein